MTRPGLNGPRSLMRTSTEQPVCRWVTRTRELKGSVGWAAVMALRSKASPEAVFWPCQ